MTARKGKTDIVAVVFIVWILLMVVAIAADVRKIRDKVELLQMQSTTQPVEKEK